MSNNLPFFTDECAQTEIRKTSRTDMEFASRWYETDTGKFHNMDRKFICSTWEPARCAIELIWEGYTPGAITIVDTDYENYEIRYSMPMFAGINYMEAIWVSARKPLTEGTAEYDEWYALVSAAMATHIPEYPMHKLSVIKHPSNCKYSLGDPTGQDDLPQESSI